MQGAFRFGDTHRNCEKSALIAVVARMILQVLGRRDSVPVESCKSSCYWESD